MRVPELSTARLRLRRYRESDRAGFVELFADGRVMSHMGGALDREEAGRMFSALLAGRHRRALSAWTVEERESAEHVGHAALLSAGGGAVELGFLVRPERWGAGLGTEIARALVADARARHPEARVVATVDVDHPASRRVLAKAGLALAEERHDGDGAYLLYALPDRELPGDLPDARDGLTRLERVILVELARLEAERGGAPAPTIMLYGRVLEHLDVSAEVFQATLSRLVGR